jgi:gas vesicle protein
MKRGKALLGILGGIAAGALLGILLAPDKGSNTRKKIVKKGEGYVDGVKDKFNEMIDDVNTKIESVMNEATSLARKTKAKINSVKEDVDA